LPEDKRLVRRLERNRPCCFLNFKDASGTLALQSKL